MQTRVSEAWADLKREGVAVEQAEVQLNLGFEGAGDIYIVKGKATANLNVKLVLKPRDSKMPLKNEAAVFCISKAGSDEAGAGFVVHCSPPYSWLCTCRHAIEEICGDKNPRESLHLIRVQECNPVDLFMDETGFPEDLALLKFENFPETPCWPLALQDAEEAQQRSG